MSYLLLKDRVIMITIIWLLIILFVTHPAHHLQLTLSYHTANKQQNKHEAQVEYVMLKTIGKVWSYALHIIII